LPDTQPGSANGDGHPGRWFQQSGLEAKVSVPACRRLPDILADRGSLEQVLPDAWQDWPGQLLTRPTKHCQDVAGLSNAPDDLATLFRKQIEDDLLSHRETPHARSGCDGPGLADFDVGRSPACQNALGISVELASRPGGRTTTAPDCSGGTFSGTRDAPD